MDIGHLTAFDPAPLDAARMTVDAAGTCAEAARGITQVRGCVGLWALTLNQSRKETVARLWACGRVGGGMYERGRLSACVPGGRGRRRSTVAWRGRWRLWW